MVRYIKSVVDQAGGTEKFAEHCRDHDVKLNLGSPPFICLLPVRQPSPTKFNLSLVGSPLEAGDLIFSLQIKWGPIMLFCLKIIILSVDLIYLIVGYSPSGLYLDLDNIHAVLNIPAGLVGIYCYNIYLGPTSQFLGDSSKKHLGTILLMEYVLFDVLRLFYVFLAGSP